MPFIVAGSGQGSGKRLPKTLCAWEIYMGWGVGDKY